MFNSKSLAKEWGIPTKQINMAIVELQLKLRNDEEITSEQAEQIKVHLGVNKPLPQLAPDQNREHNEQRKNPSAPASSADAPQNALTITEAAEIYGESLVKELVPDQALVSPEDAAVLDAIVAEQRTEVASLQQAQNNISSEQELLRTQLQQAAMAGVQKAQLLHLAERYPMLQTRQALIEKEAKTNQEQSTQMQKFITQMYSDVEALSGVNINSTVQGLDDTSKKMQNRANFILRHSAK